MRQLAPGTSPTGPHDPPMRYVVVEVLAVVALVGFLATLVYAPLLATLLLGGVVGALVGTMLPRRRRVRTTDRSTERQACCVPAAD